ncbi:hypothetical protein [Janthinobacterium sp. RB2R34]|uniref:hypothetical protein n=1 Tax=Janthinobacterium sp. RB2R34 TaxID=3424193 RepID=UPI003F1FADC3
MKKIFSFLGIDRAVAYTLLGRGWSSLAGLATLWFIVKNLSLPEQGFYYTFSSVIALQIIFELGMSYVVMQFASHEMIKLYWSDDGTLDGDDFAKGRVRSLLQLVLKWYGVVALLILLTVLPAGWIFFSNSDHGGNISWQLPWAFLTVMAALNIIILPILSILEGCGRIAEVARMRMLQNIAGSVFAWITLTLGGGLLALPMLNMMSVVVALWWFWKVYHAFFADMWHSKVNSSISWRHEIWPFQWKIALSWLSGYLILQLFVPVLFSYQGAVPAGQMGMSLSIGSAISSIAIAWINTKAPTFGNLIASKRYTELDTLFARILKQSMLVVVFGGLGAFILKYALTYFGSNLADRMLPLLPFSLLMLVAIVNHVVFAEAIYLRSHKREPFMWLSLAIGISICISTFYFGKNYGVTSMMAAYLLICTGGLIWGTLIFRSKRVQWHADSNTDAV